MPLDGSRDGEAALAPASELAERLRARGLRVDTSVVVDLAVAEALREVARRDDVVMLAVSTHGEGGLRRLLLGSAADKLIRAAERPVLVKRPARRPAARKAPARRATSLMGRGAGQKDRRL